MRQREARMQTRFVVHGLVSAVRFSWTVLRPCASRPAAPWLSDAAMTPSERGGCSCNLAYKHGDGKPLARGLTQEKLALPLRQMATLAIVLGMGMCKETCPKKDGVLAVPLPQRIYTLIQM